MKLTPSQTVRLQTAYTQASVLLNEIKLKPLKGKALEDMKILQGAVQSLEVLLATSTTH